MLSALVVSPHPSVPGGVSVFIESMKRNATRTEFSDFYVGSPGRGAEPLKTTWCRLWKAPRELSRMAREHKPDIVHINPSFNVKSLIRDGLLLRALNAAGHKNILFYVHGWDWAFQRVLCRFFPLRRLAAATLNKAALITVLGEDFRDGLIALGVDPHRILVTRTMFEGKNLTPLPMRDRGSRRDYILFLSRFEREKGGAELLTAFAAVADEYPDIDLVMAGDGPETEALTSLCDHLDIAGRVSFCGYVGGAQKDGLLRDCAIFALPTYYRSEGMPVSVLEGMGAGKPLLVGSAGALNSIVSDPANGVVLRQVSAQTVEAGLRRLLDDAAFAQQAGKTNAAIAAQKFEAAIVTAEIEGFYQKVAQC